MKNSRPNPIHLMRRLARIVAAISPAGAVLATVLLSGCATGETSDAYGNFEATEVTVSARASGQLLRLSADEGDRLEAGAVVGLVDTTRLSVRRMSLLSERRSAVAARRASAAQRPEIDARIATFEAQLRPAESELARTERLLRQGAATERELEQRSSAVDVLVHQIEQARAQIQTVEAQTESLGARIEQIDARLRELDEDLSDARITNPVSGIVLTVVAHVGETVAPGRPLYTIASLDTLDLKAYATGDQLSRLRLGATVEVLFDGEDGELQSTSGVLSRISDRAQFTPTPIQTRDNRADLVYAFEVRVPNPNGLMKIGMPGEVRLETDARAEGE